MKFSLWNFKDWYTDHGIDLSYNITDGSASISMLSSSPAAADRRIGCATVLSGDTLTDCSGFHTVLQYGSDRLLFPVASPIEVWNCGNEMLRCYTNWENTLFDDAAACTSPDALFTTAQQLFPFPFAMLSLRGTVLYRSDDCYLSLPLESTQMILQAATKTPPYQAVCRTFSFDRTQSFLVKAITSGNTPIAVLAAYENNSRLCPGHLPLFHVIAEVFELFLRFHTQTALTSHPLAEWFRSALQSNPEQPLNLPPHIEEIRWQPDDFFQIAAVSSQQDSFAALSSLADRLTSAGHCCILTSTELLVLLHHGKQPAADEFSMIPPQFYVGLSLPFCGLQKLRPYAKQAIRAAEQAAARSLPLFAVSQHLSDCLLEQCRALPNARSLIHPDILLLAESDAAGNDALLHSLYTYYIYGCSISRAADVLYIHRNTMRQRLNHIRALLPHDIDDPQIRPQYLLSLLLLPAA